MTSFRITRKQKNEDFAENMNRTAVLRTALFIIYSLFLEGMIKVNCQ